MTGAEQQYDEIVAPMLKEVADRCKELGMSLIARVEWEPGESGITQIGPHESIGQFMTHAAAHSHGNIDKMLLHLIKNRDVSQSIFLHSYNKFTSETARPQARDTPEFPPQAHDTLPLE